MIAFDNSLYAWYAIFQVITVEQWVDIMFPLMDSYSSFVWIYFVVLVFVGNFFAVNLFLIIINSQFSHTKARENALVKAKAEKRDKILREREERAVENSHTTAVDVLGELCRNLRMKGMAQEAAHLRQVELQAQVAEDREDMIALISEVRKESKYLMSMQDDGKPGRDKVAETLDELVANLEWQLNAESVKFIPANFIKWMVNWVAACQDCIKNDPPMVKKVRDRLMKVMNHPWFGYAVYGAILANAVTMATEGTPVPPDARKSANVAFTFFFLGEMLLKLMAMGFFAYFSDSLNRFDAFIVATSLVDVMLGGGGAMAVLRAFRLMRVFKLARFLPSLRKQLEVIGKSLGGALDFTFVLVLFVFIFAVFGMYLFGGQFGFEDRGPYTKSDSFWQSERANFDDPFWASITVFQIITMEDWPPVMEDAVRETGFLAGMYFVAVIVMGQFILLSLFVAILLEGFAELKAEEEDKLIEDLKKYRETNAWAFQRMKHLMDGVLQARLADFFLQWKETASFRRLAGFKMGNWKVASLAKIREEHKSEWALHAFVRMKQNRQINFRDECFLWWKLVVHEKEKAALLSEERNLVAMQQSDYADISDKDFPTLRRREAKSGGWSSKKNSNAAELETDLPHVARFTRKTSVTEIPLAKDELGSKPDVGCGSGNGHVSHRLTPFLWTQGVSMGSGSDSSSMSDTGMGAGGNAWKKYKAKPAPKLPESKLDAWAVPVKHSLQKSAKIAPKVDISEELEEANEGELPAIEEPPPGPHWSKRDLALCCLGPENCLRVCCARIIASPKFDNLVLVLIATQSVLMAIESPQIEDGSWWRWFLDISNNIFVLVFTLEMLIRIIALGLIYGPTPYLSNSWNRLDFVVVIVAWGDLALEYLVDTQSSIVGVLRVMRLLRALRPLRAIRRAPKLRLIVKTVLASVKPISETLLVCAVFLFIFGILGIQLFGDKFHYCDAPENITSQCMTVESSCIFNKDQCLAARYVWRNSELNFDNLLYAVISLFYLCTGDGWVTMMHQGVDGIGPDTQPQRGHAPIKALYFVSAIVIGNFFLINLFIGVVVDNFARMVILVDQQERNGEIEEDDEFNDAEAAWAQREMLERQKEERKAVAAIGKAESEKRKENPEITRRIRAITKLSTSLHNVKTAAERASLLGDIDDVRERMREQDSIADQIQTLEQEIFDITHGQGEFASSWLHQLVTSIQFELVVSGVIVANVVVMAIEYYNMPDLLIFILACANGLFTLFFIVEAGLKMGGLGCAEYWTSGWNRFDFFVIIVGLLSTLIDLLDLDATIGINPTVLRVLRVFRLTRILRVLRASPGVQALLETIAAAMDQVLSLGTLMLLIFFVYACAGVELFGRVGCSVNECQGFHPHSNFDNFPQAMLALFRVCTADNGYGMLRDTMRVSPHCDDSATCEHDCCAMSWLAALYFVTFVLATKLVLLNVVVAILMVQLNVANEDVLLESLRNQTQRLEDLSMDADDTDLLEELGLEKERTIDVFQSDIMKKKHERDAEQARIEASSRTVLKPTLGGKAQHSSSPSPTKSSPTGSSVKDSAPSSPSKSPSWFPNPAAQESPKTTSSGWFSKSDSSVVPDLADSPTSPISPSSNPK